MRKQFSDPKRARGLVEHALPADIIARLDLNRLHLASTSHVDDQLDASYSDLLFETTLDSRTAILQFIIEHKSGAAPHVPVQLLGYCAVRLGQLAAVYRPLPVVLPVLLYHGPRAYSGPLSIQEMMELPPSDALLHHVPSLNILVCDIGMLTDDQILQLRMDAIGHVTIWALATGRDAARLSASIPRWAPILEQLIADPQRRRQLDPVLTYLYRTADEGPLQQLNAAAPQIGQHVMGLAQQHLEQGRHEGQALMLGRQLTAKFGELTPAQQRRLAAMSDAALQAASVRILNATSIDEVLGNA